MSNVKVAAAIQTGQTALSERLEVTVDRVVRGLLSEAEGKDDSTASSRVAAWSHLAKHLGMDGKDLRVTLENKPADEMTPAELEAESERLEAELAALEVIN